MAKNINYGAGSGSPTTTRGAINRTLGISTARSRTSQLRSFRARITGRAGGRANARTQNRVQAGVI